MILRLLEPGDADAFGTYLEALSEESRNRFGPHPHTMEEAVKLCSEIDISKYMRFIALADDRLVIAYLILIPGVSDPTKKRYQGYGCELDGDSDCTFAPSVADEYQDRGLGTVLFGEVREVAQELGFQRMVLSGGVQVPNLRGVHYYEKLGFKKVGEFTTRVENLDMMLEMREKRDERR